MTRADKFLIFIIGIIGIFGLLKNFYPLLTKNILKSSPAYAGIFYQNKLVATYPLSVSRRFFVGPAEVLIADGKIRIVKNNCPNQLCVHTGAIKYPGQNIVCIPNKILITIVAPESSLDSVSY